MLYNNNIHKLIILCGNKQLHSIIHNQRNMNVDKYIYLMPITDLKFGYTFFEVLKPFYLPEYKIDTSVK